jgi:signal transduction histidine kinase
VVNALSSHTKIEDRLYYTQPVVHNNKRLGTLVLVSDMRPIDAIARDNLLLSVLIGAVATLGAILLAARLQQGVTGPVNRLVHASRHVSTTGDFSIRVQVRGRDELALLSRTFNHMLEQIQERERRLQGAQTQLSQTNEQLRRRNQEMEQFVYTASHELKQPVVTISGFLSVAREAIQRNDIREAQQAMQRIDAAVQRIARRLQGLLALSDVEHAPFRAEPVDPASLCQELSVSVLAPLIAQKQAEIRIDPQMPKVRFDRTLLKAIFHRLLENAVQYGCSGTERIIEVGHQRAEEEVRFFVRDRGQGIAEEQHQRVFGLFQRLSRDDLAVGVGLTIVNKIAQMHGGRAWIQSKPGSGATAWFALPRRSLCDDPTMSETCKPNLSASC